MYVELFDRDSEEVLRAVKTCTLEEFVNLFKGRTSEVALRRIYKFHLAQLLESSRGKNTKKIVAKRTSIIEASDPLDIDRMTIEEIVTIQDKEIEAKDVVEKQTRDSEKVRQRNYKNKSKKQRKTRAAVRKVVSVLPRRDAKGFKTKADLIRNIIDKNPDISNYDIVRAIRQLGITCHYSEIDRAKAKGKNQQNKHIEINW
jgi:hypothetical protein